MKRILVAVTPSPSSRLALTEAIKLATRSGARVCLIRVVRRSSAAIARSGTWLQRMEDQIPHKLSDGALAFRGSSPGTICRAAEGYHADLVMLGARTYGALARIAGPDDPHMKRLGPKLLIVREGRETREGRPPTSPSKPMLHTHHDHALLEATTLAGAATGALTGVMGGPPGILIGGAIGTAIGMLAGKALEDADERASQHDHVLDDTIGVTRGSLGLDPPGLRTDSAEAEPSLAGAGQTLRRDHQRLEELYDALLTAHEEGDWAEVRAEWAICEPTMRDHMSREERKVFPALREINPREAALLLAEHVELRALLDKIAIGIELKAIGTNQLQALIERLREHGKREDALLYPWMDESISLEKLKTTLAA